ncbi:MAG: exosome complex protein Rrp42 [Candidatus Aenigmatarchaeota archaeon]
MSDVMELTKIEKQHVRDTIEKGERVDGRDFMQTREIDVKTGVAKNAEGSARVEIGGTKVIVGVKIDVGEPFPDTPDEGMLMVNAELGPMASPDFESGPPGEDATELARVVDRGIRESETIDFNELCIEEGEKAWKVMVDIHTLDDDGNLMDASALGAIKALKEASLPGYEDGEVLRDEENELDVKKTPIACTVANINDQLIVDPNLKEEEVAETSITVTWMEDGLCSLQKRGSGGFSMERIEDILEIAEEKTSEMREIIGE